MKRTIVTFCVKSNDSAGTVGKLVIATAAAQLHCVRALAWEVCVLAFEPGASIDISLDHWYYRHSVALTDSVSVMTPGSG